jgi:phosphatidylinositol alpha-1,6-mannosyltransferase
MPESGRRLLFIDMAYTVESVRRRSHSQFFNMRHSGGYWGRVWGVHPLADIAGKKSRTIEFIRFSKRQTIIEGVAESLALPKFLLPLNFIVSQLKLVNLLRRLICQQRISLIFSTDAYYSGLLGWLLGRLTGRPQIVAVYGNQDDIYEASGALAMPRLIPFRWMEKIIARFVLSRANLVIAASRNNLDFAIANGARGETAIVPVAKNIDDVHLRPPELRDPPDTFARLGIAPGTPLMLYVGRLIALKHPDEAVLAMAAVIQRRPDAIGLLAGAGAMREQLVALASRAGAADRIHFLGQVDQVELSRLIPHCITLSPLTGMALIECGLGGSPMVSFDRDWQAEFVEDGVNGFLVPFRDHQAMAERTLKLISDETLRRKMARAARERAFDYCDRDRIYAKEQALYDRLIAGSLPSRRS